MNTISRRNFLKASAAAAITAGLFGACGASSSSNAPAADTTAAMGDETMAATTGAMDNETEMAPADMNFEGAELVVATWGWAEGGLLKLCADFEAMYGCSIIVDPTPGNGDRVNKLMAEKDDPQADIALLTKSFADTCNSQDLFEMIDTSVVTSLPELYDFAQNPDGFGPCYSLCRYGIMYDADALEEADLPVPMSYQELFDDKYAGMVALPDMASTAGPYMLVAMEEAMGGTQEDVSDAFALMQEKKDNIALWYTTTADVQTAFTNKEIAITVFMDINMKGLIDAGINMKWQDAEEGTFGAPATVNVVKNCKNPELAQLFVEYLISKAAQDKIADVMVEAPVNMNAEMSDEQKIYLAYGEDAMDALKSFDEAYINEHKAEWIETFQKTVAI